MASKVDKRLLGIWKSDRRKTFKNFVWPKKATEKGKRKLRALFGDLTVRYTRQRVYSRIRETDLDPEPYEVLGSDASSVAVLFKGESFIHDGPWIAHIRFEGDLYYWIDIPLYTPNRECFRRINGDSQQ